MPECDLICLTSDLNHHLLFSASGLGIFGIRLKYKKNLEFCKQRNSVKCEFDHRKWAVIVLETKLGVGYIVSILPLDEILI